MFVRLFTYDRNRYERHVTAVLAVTVDFDREIKRLALFEFLRIDRKFVFSCKRVFAANKSFRLKHDVAELESYRCRLFPTARKNHDLGNLIRHFDGNREAAVNRFSVGICAEAVCSVRILKEHRRLIIPESFIGIALLIAISDEICVVLHSCRRRE